MANIKHHRVTSVSALLVVSFLLLFALNPEAFSALVDTTYAWSATHFGLFWQVFMHLWWPPARAPSVASAIWTNPSSLPFNGSR